MREEVCARHPALGLVSGLRTPAANPPEIVTGPGAEIPVIVVPTEETPGQMDSETRALLPGR